MPDIIQDLKTRLGHDPSAAEQFLDLGPKITESGTTVLDFGSTPTVEASVDVTGLTDITATSHVRVVIQADTMLSNGEIAHEMAAFFLKLWTTLPTAGVGFTIRARSIGWLATGRFRTRWVWSP